ncbi:glycosyltransferase [bacterium]|nr:glycosyltransferase [bacterium]
MKKLLIIDYKQFGYHTGNFHHCKYLKEEYSIGFICWDQGFPKIEIEGVVVIYVNRRGNILLRAIRFLRLALREVKDKRTIIFIKYFKVVSLAMRLLKPHNFFILDIRTGSVHKKQIYRRFYDARMKFETRFFKNVTVISQSLAEKLKIAHKSHILPLGADIISSTKKTFKSLHLLYVGTLLNRNIEVTVHGFKLFYDEFKERISIAYTIIGDGTNNEAQDLRGLVSKYGLSDVVKVTGLIPYTNLAPYYDTCNIGVSYVPLTDYYDCQPVTKTFEYLLSGMPVIATNTSENRAVIQNKNGVLIGETADDFYVGLKTISKNRMSFDSDNIRFSKLDYKWENIVENNLKPYLYKVFRS